MSENENKKVKKKKETGKKGLTSQFIKYYKPYKGAFFFDMFCALLIAVANLVYPSIARSIINDYAPSGNIKQVLVWSGVMAGIFVAKAVLNYCVTYWGHLVGNNMQSDMRRELFAHLEKLPFSYYDETKTGSIMSRLTNDLFEVSELAHHGPEDLFLSIITMVGAIVFICSINVWLSLIVFFFMPFMIITVTLLRKKMLAVFAETRETTALINSDVESAVSGIRVSKAYVAEEHEIKRFEVCNGKFKEARRKNYSVMAQFTTAMGIFIDFLYLVSLAAGGIFLAKGYINSGDMAAYILYVTTLISPIRTFISLFEQVEMGMSGFKRFREIMDIAPEKDDGNVKVDKLKGDVKFDHVSFSYKSFDEAGKTSSNDESGEIGSHEKLVINDLCLDIKHGQTVALVGPSGGGKTTLCNLIPRFYEIDAGSISIDGINVNDIPLKDLRRNVGTVQQDVFLYGGSVRENIAYGNLDATDEQIIQAAKLANIHDYIMTLPEGYNTYVGERGVKLSGGQKQRVSIARAFLKNPPILILDEATSALDNATEMLIQQSLDKLSEGRTTIVVAHRLSTVKNADEIIVVTADGIAERGSHEELLNKNGIYAELYKYQFKSYQ